MKTKIIYTAEEIFHKYLIGDLAREKFLDADEAKKIINQLNFRNSSGTDLILTNSLLKRLGL